MIGHASLFSQVLSLIDRHHFAARVKELKAEKHAKGFTCWEQFVAMLFCQMAQAKSLREIVQGLQCCEGKLRHLGIENTRSDPPCRMPMNTGHGSRTDLSSMHCLIVVWRLPPARNSGSRTNC